MKSLNQKIVTRLLHDGGDVCFYGICELAEYSLLGANELGLVVSGIFDTTVLETKGRYFSTIPKLGQDSLSSLDKGTPIIVTCTHFITVQRHLNALGFYNIYDHGFLIGHALTQEKLEGYAKMDAERMYLASKEKVKHATQEHGGDLVIPSIDVIITEKCTLKCTDCANLMPYFKKPKNIDYDDIFACLTTLSGLADSILELRILGGEPFMRKDIERVIEFCANVSNAKKVVLYTNATLVPRQPALEAMKHEKVFVEITDYGALSPRLVEIVRAFEQEGISYVTKELPESWDDSANIIDFQRTDTENQTIFDTCCAKYLYTLMHGKLYRCPFSASLDALEEGLGGQADWLDVQSRETLSRAELRSYIYSTRFVPSCEVCQGRSTVLGRVPAARQSTGKRQPFVRVP
jgi:organic radical activating enzyme